MSVCIAVMYYVRLYYSHVLCPSVLQSCTVSVCIAVMYYVRLCCNHVLCPSVLQSCTMSVCIAIMYCVRLYSSRVLCLSVLQSCTMSVCPYSDCSVWGKNDQCWGITACCLHLEIAPSLISLMVSVDVKHHVYLLISKCNYLSLTFYPIAVI